MLEGRKILTALIGYIIGIIMGLYCKISIVPFYLAIYLIYLIKPQKHKSKFKLISFRRYYRYLKLIFNKNVLIIIITFSIISNSIILFKNLKFEKIQKDLNGREIVFTGVVVLQEQDKYKVKITDKKYKNICIYLYYKNNRLNYGDEIVVKGLFNKPAVRSNYKGFDYCEFLKTKNIYGVLKAENLTLKAKNKGNIFIKYTQKLSYKITNRIQKSKLTENEKAIILGILLGNKQNIEENTLEAFENSNILYILAVSGMHISYMILIFSNIFNIIVGKHWSKPLTSFIILIYICITNFTPSVVRAGISGILLIMSKFFYKKNDIWQSLSIPLLIMLMYNPFLIKNIGLQLSYVSTIGIIVLYGNLNRWINYNLEILNKRAIRRNNKRQLLILKIVNLKIIKKLQDAVILTFSVMIFTLPIVLIYFKKLNITNIIISIVTGFLVGPIMSLSLIFVVIDIHILERTLSFLIECLTNIAYFGEKLPLNQIYLCLPNLLQIFIYYCLIIYINFSIKVCIAKKITPIQKRAKNLVSLTYYKIKLYRKKIYSSILLIFIIYCLILLIPKNLNIHFVDVRQGDCTLIITPKHKTILIDGGGSENDDYDIR